MLMRSAWSVTVRGPGGGLLGCGLAGRAAVVRWRAAASCSHRCACASKAASLSAAPVSILYLERHRDM